jgi:hypothetical protein
VINLLLSIFGLFISDKFVSRLEKFKMISDHQKRILFMIMNVPNAYFIFFKDQIVILFIYIGLILLSLTFFSIYFDYLLKKTFFDSQIRVLDGLSLNIKSGVSSFKSAKIVFETLSSFEKITFESLHFLNSTSKVPIYASFKYTNDFFAELEIIFQSQVKVSDQLDQFKKGLRVQKSIRHKSRMAALQVRAQAIVAVFIYLFLLGFSICELNLLQFPVVIVFSLLLMSCGVYFILLKGNKVKWTI